MSHHDHKVGESVESHANPPGGSQDPEPLSTGYFVLWGFTLLLVSVVSLQYLSADWAAARRDQNSGNTNLGAAAEFRSEQEARMPRIKSAMNKIAKKHGGR